MTTLPTPWVEGLTIGQALQQTAAKHPANDAMVFPQLGLRIKYREFLQEVDRTARGLLSLGIQPGDHVAIWATNVPQWVLVQFATARIGAVLVTINPAYRPFELEYVLKQSNAKMLLLVDRFKKSDYHAMLAECCPELCRADLTHSDLGQISSKQFPKLRWIVSLKGDTPAGALSWEQLLERGESLPTDAVANAARDLKPSDAINIQYTSGTTGFPKAATLSHRNLLLNVFYSGECQAYSSADRICIPVPFYHCFGCVLGTLCAVVYGAAMVVPAESFDPKATLAAIEQERATSLYGVPTMFIAQLHEPSRTSRDLTSLRTGVMAGSPCPIETMRAVVDQMGCREVTIGYGQTEASPIITQTRTDDPLELRVETVGRPLPGVEVKVIDPATGEALPDNQQGELCARGHVVMIGYYGNAEATAEAIDSDGWLHTGDLAVRLSNGYYKITGRIKDMVIRGGENIYPREIEEFLFTHPAIEQASVVGVPDLKYGEELCAWIKLKQDYAGVILAPDVIGTSSNLAPSANHLAPSDYTGGQSNLAPSDYTGGQSNLAPSDYTGGQSNLAPGDYTRGTIAAPDRTITDQQIRDYCRRKLAHFKVPKYVRFVEAFPQTVTGKIQKFKIREQMCEQLGLTEQVTA